MKCLGEFSGCWFKTGKAIADKMNAKPSAKVIFKNNIASQTLQVCGPFEVFRLVNAFLDFSLNDNQV